ncbi:flagellar hook-associated protein FlgK [Heyndrickxia vini]|uniref:Flagellar hook-associated protein 1 n=1 Tax=Heyndrickxia vini TaxID=1476025 RepID=A0ABX7E7I8_9BACI|nr:flagellar hook-associated protein FlgK [Heyndrickxia vini]QQZ10267.1 flagellar hook-associated protein FlgK [Heyndrickxia vini]
MISTFHGLETAKRGMNTQQSALYVTGQNISNANTLGYTRQRINFEATEAYPSASMNRPQIPGQMGTGVTAGSVQRVRESFLDLQYRGENNKLGYWNSRADSLAKMEDIMNEPSDTGLSSALGQFWQSLQDLSVNPENDGARSVVLQRGQAVSETFRYLSDSISGIQDNIGNEIGVSVKNINSILKQISDVNKQISEVEPHGYLPNDLYDERDRLVDELSTYFNVKVEVKQSGGKPSPLAEGIYDIKLTNPNGQEIYLVQGSNYNSIGIDGGTDSDGDGSKDQPPKDGLIGALLIGGTTVNIANANGVVGLSQGKLRGLIESYGYQYTTKDAGGNDITKEVGIYPDMLDQLDKLAFTFGTIFNEVHKQGYDLNGEHPTEDFFVGLTDGNYKGAAAKIQLNDKMTNSMLAASSAVNADGKVESGNGQNAINLSKIQGMNIADLIKGPVSLEGGLVIDLSGNPPKLPFDSGTISSNYQAIIGKLGVDAQQANRLTSNSATLRQTVDENRQSVSSVSIDEEFINMIKFQQAYNASARNITIVDEMLDKIINGMGLGGR